MNQFVAIAKELIGQIPRDILSRSGKIFYSGSVAFTAPAPLYVLGLNPGGDPREHEAETIESHADAVWEKLPADWSAYRDESWKGASAGSHGMQPRVLHLFAGLGLSPGHVPCSNLVFVRSRREGNLKQEMQNLADLCWPFHALAIQQLRPSAILCFGKTAGQYVCGKVGAKEPCGEFVEGNNRRWRSRAYASTTGLKVVVATHPSVANWCTPTADPTPLVRGVLQ
jgi:hypothetical protein